MGKEEVIGKLFEVEKLCDKKVENGVVYYLVKWMGFGEDENSWEPEANIVGPYPILDFERRHAVGMLQVEKLQKVAQHSLVVANASLGEFAQAVSEDRFVITNANGDTVVQQEMLAHHAFVNVRFLYRYRVIERYAFGLALSPIDNLWRDHYWGVKDGQIVETDDAKSVYYELKTY